MTNPMKQDIKEVIGSEELPFEICKYIYSELGKYHIVNDTWDECTQARTDIIWDIAVNVISKVQKSNKRT